MQLQQERLLPCSYYLLTFTLPQPLRALALKHPRTVYGALLRCAASALQKLAADPRYVGGRLGCLAVRHTWTRALRYHPHVHLLVSAGGLSADRTQWLSPKNPAFLVPVRALSGLFRAQLCAALKKAALLPSVPTHVWKKNWVVHCQHAGRGQKVLAYLGRYLFRVALSYADAVDENADGKADSVGFRFQLSAYPFLIKLPVDCVDVNDNGEMDFLKITCTFGLGVSFDSSLSFPDFLFTSALEIRREVHLPLADTNDDGANDSPTLDFDQDGRPDPGASFPIVAGPPNPEVEHKLNFAHFGDGFGIFSQITLVNLDRDRAAAVKIILRDDDGNPLNVDLAGEEVQGEKHLQIAAGGLSLLRTDGAGNLAVGSVTVSSNRPLAGVILFGGAFGVAGVGSSQVMTNGFVAPMESKTADSINTGVAVASLEAVPNTLQASLWDSKGSNWRLRS